MPLSNLLYPSEKLFKATTNRENNIEEVHCILQKDMFHIICKLNLEFENNYLKNMQYEDHVHHIK